MYAIDKNIQIPPSPYSRRGEMFATLAALQVGDSFLLNENEAGKNACNDVHGYGRTHGQKFTVRKVSERGLRIWRVS